MKGTGRKLINNSNINTSNQNETSSQKAFQPKSSLQGQSSTHKQDQQASLGVAGSQSFQKLQLKLQQMPSATTPSQAQGTLSGVGSGMLAAGGSSLTWDRVENQHSSNAVQQLLNYHQQQKRELPGQGQYAQGSSFNKKSIRSDLDKPIGSTGFSSKDAGGLENQTGINPTQVPQQNEMNPVSNQLFGVSRSPHQSHVFKKRPAGLQAQQNPMNNKANLNLIAHPFSDSKRNQNQEALAGKAAQIRASQYGPYSGNVLEQTNSQGGNQTIQSKAGSGQQQRPAGKATGMQPGGDSHHHFMDQSSTHWKTNDPQWMPGEEKTSVSHSVHSNIFSKAGQGAFQRKQFAGAGQHTQYGSKDNILNPLLPGSRSYYQQFTNIDTPVNPQSMVMKQQRNHTLQKEDMPKAMSPTNNFNFNNAGNTNANFGQNIGSEVDASTSANTRGFKAQTISTHLNNMNTTLNEVDQFKVSGTKMVHDHSSAYEFAKPQVIQNKGGQVAGHAQRRTFSRGRKGQAHMMSSGLTVMGLPFSSDAPQAQDLHNTSSTQPPEESIEMTPEQTKDKAKRRSLNIVENNSVCIKVPIQPKGQPNLHNTLEQLEEEHRAQATRANSIGKTNKRNNKLSQPVKSGQQTTDFQDLFNIQKIKKENMQALRHQSFQGGNRIKPIQKNPLFKLQELQASGASQLNEAGALVNISPQNQLPGGSNPQPSFPATQDLKLTQPQKSSEKPANPEDQITSSQGQSKRNAVTIIQPPNIHGLLQPSQQKLTQDKLKKHRTEDQPAQRQKMQHSPEESEQAKVDQLPLYKLNRSPHSNRKRLVIPMQQPPAVSPSARVEEQKRVKASTSRYQINAPPFNNQDKQQDQIVMIEHDVDHNTHEMKNRESHKHRNIKQIIKHNKQLQQIQNLKVSSFNSQKKSNEEESSDNQGDLNMMKDGQEGAEVNSSDDDLERDVNAIVPDIGQGLTQHVAKNPNSFSSVNTQPQEEEEKDEVNLIEVDGPIPEGDGSPSILPALVNLELQPQQRQQQLEVNKIPPIFGKNKEKIMTNLKKDMLDSDNFSKFNHSSDSSFARTFNRLLEESEGLRWQYKMILRRQLSIDNDVYSDFVDRIISKNKELLQNYSRSLPLNRKREDFFDQIKPFTFNNVVNYIENEKMRVAQSEQNQREEMRLVHSDMSGRFLTNSGGQSHASILSPNFSGGNGHSGIRVYRQLHSHKRRLHRYLSVSYGGHPKQANSAHGFALPDLFHRQRNSVCDLIGKLGGISDNSLSHRYQRAKESSTSNKTTPTPSQNNNQKLQNLQDAANKVQIVSPIQHQAPQNPQDQKNSAQPQSLAQIYGRSNQNKRNLNKNLDLQEKQKFNNFQQLANQQIKQENNFMQTKAPNQTSKVYGTIIEWQQGKLLGSGTTGQVYEAININSGEMFVVKKIQLVHPFAGLDQNKAKAVKKEIDRYKQLDYKYIVKYLGCEIIDNNVFCIYLEYMPGGSIADICREFGRIGETIARPYIHQVLKALNYLHTNNVVHGDLKGANVLLNKDAQDIKLCDLGNSLQFDQEKSMASVNSLCNGTLAWMAPEAQFSKIGKKSDVWSLGCLLVEMLTGENPWGKRLQEGNSAVISLQEALMAKERPKIPTHASLECQNFIDKCLNHSYKDRPYAHELLEDPWIRQLGPPSTSS